MDIEQDPGGEKYVLQKNNGNRIIPTIEFPDGSILAEPTNAEWAAKLGLKTKARRGHYDLMMREEGQPVLQRPFTPREKG